LEREPEKEYKHFTVLKTRHKDVENCYTMACLGKTGEQKKCSSWRDIRRIIIAYLCLKF
jgi:hypothetical protein